MRLFYRNETNLISNHCKDEAMILGWWLVVNIICWSIVFILISFGI